MKKGQILKGGIDEMLSIILSLICVGAIILGVFAAKDNQGENVGVPFIVFGLLCGAILVLLNLFAFSSQISDCVALRALDAKITLFTERRDNLTEIVRVELNKYPDYEKKIINNINPKFLLNYPRLRSNETIMETAKQILQLQDKVYSLQEEVINTQRSMYYREISPWLIYVTPYKKFFGRPNPLVSR